MGRPLYGDVFGTNQTNENDLIVEPIDSTLWGEMESEDEESEVSEEEPEGEEEEGEEAKDADDTGLVTPAIGEGLMTPSIPSAGLETPDIIELRYKLIDKKLRNLNLFFSFF